MARNVLSARSNAFDWGQPPPRAASPNDGSVRVIRTFAEGAATPARSITARLVLGFVEFAVIKNEVVTFGELSRACAMQLPGVQLVEPQGAREMPNSRWRKDRLQDAFEKYACGNRCLYVIGTTEMGEIHV